MGFQLSGNKFVLGDDGSTDFYKALTGNSQDNFFTKRAKSIENALGTTAATAIGGVNELITNEGRNNMVKDQKTRLNDVAKKYGFNTYQDVWDARDKAEREGDTKTLDLINNTINPELQAQATKNKNEMDKFASNYKDYVKNDYIGQKTNQDAGKFLGSAINTESTLFDILTMAAGIPVGAVGNAVQGGVEGIADELEQSGFKDFDWQRAGQNALTGAASGAVTGKLNQGMSNALAKNGGNLFKGGNAVTRTLNNLGSSTKLGQIGSTLATGATRGAVSGAVGGATGAGLQSAMQGASVGEGISNALQGAVSGAKQGAIAGGTMAGANMAIDTALAKTNPNLYNRIKENQAINSSYGEGAKNQFKNAWESGDSITAEKVLKPIAESAGNMMNNAKSGELSGYVKNPFMAETEANTANNTKNTADINAQWDNLAKESGYNNFDDLVQSYKIANPNTEATAEKVLNWLDNKDVQVATPDAKQVMKQKINNIKADELSDRAAQDLLNQVSTVRSPVAKANNMTENVKKFMAEGLTKPEQWQLASDAITGANGKVTKLYNNLIEQAGDVDTFSGLGGKYGNNITDTIDYIIKTSGLTANDAKGVKNEIMGVLDSLPSRADGSVNMSDSAESVIKSVRMLEDIKRDYLGQDSRNYKNTDPFKEKKAKAIGKVTDVLEQRIYDKVPDATKVVTSEAIQEIKNVFPNNEKWAKSVDDSFAKVKTGKDLRAMQKRFVQTNNYLQGAKSNYGTYGQRVGDAYGNAVSEAVKKVPIVGGVLAGMTNAPVMNRLYANLNSARANKLRGEKIDLPSNTRVATGGNGGNENIASGSPEIPSSNPTTTTNDNYNPSTQLYNAIGRTEGAINRDQARVANYLVDAVQEDNANANVNAGANTLESLITPTATGSTGVYDSLYGTNNANTANSTQNSPMIGYFQRTGDYWTDILASAMTSAIDRDDIDSFGALYGMYQDSLANLQKAQTSSATQTKLTDKQRQANAAARALEDFENTESNFGYDVSNIPILGTIANIGGNEYASKAEALALQIGYMLSGATVNKDEALKIGKAYVPQPRDSEAVRQSKINQLRGIISDYQQTYEA